MAAVPDRVRATMARLGLEGVNKPKHPTKSHAGKMSAAWWSSTTKW